MVVGAIVGVVSVWLRELGSGSESSDGFETAIKFLVYMPLGASISFGAFLLKRNI